MELHAMFDGEVKCAVDNEKWAIIEMKLELFWLIFEL